MDIKKLSLIIFLLCVILLSVGIIVFIGREQSRQRNLRLSAWQTPPLAENALNNQKAANPAAAPNFTEEQIRKKIDDKKQQIGASSKGRTLTDDELYFLSFPREAAVKDLQNNQ